MTDTMTTPVDTLDFITTDAGNSQRLINCHGEDFKYCGSLGGWFSWTGVRWQLDNAAIYERAKQIGRDLLHEAADESDNHRRDRLITHARYTLGEPGQRRMVTLSSKDARVRVNPETFDSDPYLLNVANGTIDLRTGNLRPHDRSDLLTKTSLVAYDPEADDSEWMAFLERVLPDQELRDFLRRAVGYSVVGEVSEHVLFILYGLGANGKSTFTETIKAVLGDYAHRTRTESLMTSGKSSNGPTPDVANLKGRRFVYASESEEGQRLDEATIKAITGGGTINARHLYGTPFEFEPSHTLWLETNHKPRVKGTDPAIWRRLMLIPFTTTIPKEEQDRHLPERLRQKLSSVLNWIVRGCLEWQQSKEGLEAPEQVHKATEDYRFDMDRIAQFIEDECVTGAGCEVSLGKLYSAYNVWVQADDNTEKVEGKTTFSQRLEGKGFHKGRANNRERTRIWQGIGLKEDYADKADKTDTHFENSAIDDYTRDFVETGSILSEMSAPSP